MAGKSLRLLPLLTMLVLSHGRALHGHFVRPDRSADVVSRDVDYVVGNTTYEGFWSVPKGSAPKAGLLNTEGSRRRLRQKPGQPAHCPASGGLVLLAIGREGSPMVHMELEVLRTQLARQSGLRVTSHTATDVSSARAKWPAKLASARAVVVMVSVITTSRTTREETPTRSAESSTRRVERRRDSNSAVAAAEHAAADEAPRQLGSLLQLLQGTHVLLLVTSPDHAATASGGHAPSAIDGVTVRVGVPRGWSRMSRQAARLGGAMLLDASRAFLSVRGAVGGTAPLIASLITSALVSRCRLDPPPPSRYAPRYAPRDPPPPSIGMGARASAAGLAAAAASAARSAASASSSAAGPPPSAPAAAASPAEANLSEHISEHISEQTEHCAVCFSGWMGVSVARGGASLKANLIEPLRAQTLLALTYNANDGCTSVASCALAARWPALAPFAAVDMQPMLSHEVLTRTLEGLPHWPNILSAYSHPKSPVNCVRREPDNGTLSGATAGTTDAAARAPSTYRCRGIYLGNTIFAPVLGSPKLHVLRQLHDIHRCLNVAAARERSVGRMYDRIVHTRLEFEWLRPHPPLSLLQPAQAVWIPSGEDYYGGLNDRHAVLSRAAAEVYMRRWDFLMDGSIMRIDHQLQRGAVTNGVSLQDENLVAHVLDFFGIPVRRLSAAECC